jgi:hypothetical protein
MHRAVPIVCGLVFFVACLASIGTTEFPGIFDELEHISYAARLQETGSVLPRFEEQMILIRLGRHEPMGRSPQLSPPSIALLSPNGSGSGPVAPTGTGHSGAAPSVRRTIFDWCNLGT